MSYSKLNSSKATSTKLRTPESISPFSGMCTNCVDGCLGPCEIGKSAYRGREVIYPQPYGKITSASEKDYPVDFSHFNIMGTAVGAHGIEAHSDKAIFPAVSVESEIGADNKFKLKTPFVIPGLGSTDIARENWEGLAVGAALTGSILVIGENVCGMDPNVEIENGKVVHSPHLAARVKTFQDWYNGYGMIVVQSNVEDTNLGVLEYAIQKLGVEAVELKWGQGAKNIGGEVKLHTLERALELKKRGYIVLPDPENPAVEEAFKNGAFHEFERHSRIGMVDEESFLARVKELRELGAKYVFLKTGAYRPADLARAVKFASKARIDLLTVDGAGGGTGMSPWRMMNEWGIPTVYIESLLYQYLETLKDLGKFIPSAAIAGGFTLEDQIFKGFALGAPYIKAVGIGRGALSAAMVGKNLGKLAGEKRVPKEIADKYGSTIENLFTCSARLKEELGERFSQLPAGALGVYSYFDRLTLGLQQMMCGARKFTLPYIDRSDLASLTKEAAEISGIPFVMDLDKDEARKILLSC